MEKMMKTLIIVLLIISSNTAYCNESQYDEAVRKAFEAGLKQSGWDKRLEDSYKDFEKHYVPEFVVKNGAVFVLLKEAIVDQRVFIRYIYEF